MATEKAKNLGNLLQQAKKGVGSETKADFAEASQSQSVQEQNTHSKDKTVSRADVGASPTHFWEQFGKENSEATDRLNVEIKRSLHERFKRHCVENGVTKRQAVEALLEWSLGGE